ncbi:MAG TPA: acetyl-CoA carboxylase biotin carboxyl carrier protein [Pyrinomonadaceae bacterium]|jgi:acetyl-CoA carboxylase biotin carboxyl carrier protein|nr:acetyl-CoA carboxylase biotin carboxyl carrier protein [Pyrinomonadaceae bacterium]
MSTNDQNQSPPHGGESGTGAATAPQAEASSAPERAPRHGRRRRGRAEQRPQPERRAESALNLDELRELTELFTAHGLTDFELENADIRIRLSRNPAPAAPGAQAAPAQSLTPPAAVQSAASNATATGAAPNAAGAATTAEPTEEELHLITSPIVGTFYRSPAPTADAFVKVGSHVEHDTVVCIIEAMKLMNEVLAETTGTVTKVYVENGQPVEYGQPLFGVKK